VPVEEQIMPLRDHFRPPLRNDCPWESFYSAWVNMIVGGLNRVVLPAGFCALPRTYVGSRVESPDAYYLDQDTFEVQVRRENRRLVAAVELVSPANKGSEAHRRGFANKCASYLQQCIPIVIVDVATEHRDSLHDELMCCLELSATLTEVGAFALYAVAYRLKIQEEKQRLELWPEELRVGATLPTLPLWIGEDEAVPLDLEASYVAACELLRIR
jgi:hypothetical protein